jgi:hypothetical protein
MTKFNYTGYIENALINDTARDLIIIGLVTESGCTLNKATAQYAKYAKDNGTSTKVISHKADALVWLADAYDINNDDWDHVAVTHAIVTLQDKYQIAESTARDYTKAYSKELGVIHPKLDPRAAMFTWLKDNHGMDQDAMKIAFKAYATDELQRSASNVNEYWKAYEFHLFMVA